MKTRNQATLGFTVKLQVPDSVEEFAKMAGGIDKVLDMATDEEVFRGWLPVFRGKFVEALAKSTEEGGTGVPREVVGKGPKNKAGEQPDIFEKDTAYIKRVRAVGDKAKLNAIAQQVADLIPFDPSESSSTSGRIGKKYLTAAEGLAAAIAAGASTWEVVTANILAENPDFEFEFEGETGAPTIDSLAAALRADEVRLADLQKNKFLAKVA